MEISAGYVSVMFAVICNTVLVAYFGGRLTQKVDAHDKKHDEQDMKIEKHDDRIRGLETGNHRRAEL